jgi:hypothetical protein
MMSLLARCRSAVPRLAIISLVLAAVLVAACDDDNDRVITIDEDDLSPVATAVDRSPVPTSDAGEPTPPASGETVEVQGIIGAIDQELGVITINRLQGADIDRIEVGGATEIRSARGGTITIRDLRVSDRIIATGEVDDGVLVATRIEISQVVPGADPGG